jgi:NAD(P)-dependent dehydrogenase (short-subunit alcohol dehydrogenase family)
MSNVKDSLVALVTGGALRVGAAIVRELAARRYQVAIHANTSLDKAQELATELNHAGHTAPTFATKTPRVQ